MGMRARLFALCVALASWWCGVSGSCSRLRARANGRPRLAKHRHITRTGLGTTVPYPRCRNDIRQPMVHLVCAPSVSYRYRYRYWYRNVPPNSKLNQRSHPAGFQLSVDDLTHLGEDPEQAAGRRGEVGAARTPQCTRCIHCICRRPAGADATMQHGPRTNQRPHQPAEQPTPREGRTRRCCCHASWCSGSARSVRSGRLRAVVQRTSGAGELR